MLGDTITLPLSSGNVVCTKINQDNYSSEYVNLAPTQEYRIKVRHTKTGKTATKPSYDRHSFEVTHTVYEVVGVSPEVIIKHYHVIECLPGNASIVLVDGVCDLMIASSGAVITKLLGWES